MKRVSITLLICAIAGAVTLIGLARPATETTTAAAEPAQPADGHRVTDGEQAATPPAGAPAAITIEGFAFGGSTVVAPGQAVTVTNRDSAPHTVTARDGSFDTGTINGGGETTLTLPTQPGTYEFFCAIHPSMVGTVTVQA